MTTLDEIEYMIINGQQKIQDDNDKLEQEFVMSAEIDHKQALSWRNAITPLVPEAILPFLETASGCVNCAMLRLPDCADIIINRNPNNEFLTYRALQYVVNYEGYIEPRGKWVDDIEVAMATARLYGDKFSKEKAEEKVKENQSLSNAAHEKNREDRKFYCGLMDAARTSLSEGEYTESIARSLLYIAFNFDLIETHLRSR